MALGASVHHFSIQLADVDRGVYQQLSLRMARHPSETAPFLLARLLAYSLEYREGIALTEGVAAIDEPAVLVRDLTGRITTWIEVGAPTAERLHRGSRLAERCALYVTRDPAPLLAQLSGKRIHRAAEIPIYDLGRSFLGDAAATLGRRAELMISITERQLYLDVDGRSFHTEIAEHRIP